MSLQEQFDKTYISSTEVCQTLDINRTSVFKGIRAGKLPEPIIIRRANGDSAHIVLFLRALAEPMMRQWHIDIQSRKGL